MSMPAEDIEARFKQNEISEMDAVGKLKGILHPEPPAEDTPETEEVTDSETTDVVDDTVETTEDRAEEAEPEAEDQTIDAESLSQLLGLENDNLIVNDDGSIRIKTKVDGEEGNATLNDLIERYQRDAHLTNRGKEVAELKKKYEGQLSEMTQKVQQAAQQADALYKALEGEILSPYENINWQELREIDPSEYTAKRTDYRDLKERLKGKHDEIMKTLAEDWQKSQSEYQEQYQNYLTEQRGMLKSFIKDWNDDTQKAIGSYLKAEGFSDDEVARVADARLVSLAYKAMQYDKGKTTAQTKLKKPLPKVLKPGASSPSAKSVQAETLRKAQEKHNKEQSLESAIALAKAKKLFSKE